MHSKFYNLQANTTPLTIDKTNYDMPATFKFSQAISQQQEDFAKMKDATKAPGPYDAPQAIKKPKCFSIYSVP